MYKYFEFLKALLGFKNVKLIVKPDMKLRGRYEEGVIYIKSDDPNPFNFEALAHEAYHAYQSQQIGFEELIKDYRPYGSPNYIDQKVERDAYSFQLMIMRKVFGLAMIIDVPEEVKRNNLGFTDFDINRALKVSGFDPEPYKKKARELIGK